MRGPASCFILLVVFCGGITAQKWNLAADDDEGTCPRQALVRCKPQQLGVYSIKLLGELYNYCHKETQTIVLHAYIKLVRRAGYTHLRGYGWIEFLTEHNAGYGPMHWSFLQGDLPPMYIHSMVDMQWDNGTNITVTTGNYKNAGFRLDAILPTTQAYLFQFKVEGWVRTAQFAMEDFISWPGLITPFYNMTLDNNTASTQPYNALTGYTTANRRLLKEVNPSADLPPPSQSPLVVVIFLGYSPRANASLIFTAQKLLRHVEYHILQAGMQRVLVYVRENVYIEQVLRDYIAVHMPADVLQYVTFVVWNELPIVEAAPTHYRGFVYWDQFMVYYHAAVALGEHPSALAAFIDLDEALARCNTDNLISIGLTSMYALCHDCDYQSNALVEREWWTSVQRYNGTSNNSTVSSANATDANASRCRWYNDDPLRRYNRTWDDTYLESIGRNWERDRASHGVWYCRGKQLLRAISAQTFIHHRSEGLTKKEQRWLDPDVCPYIAHLANVDGYRGDEARGGLSWFAKQWSSNWWMLPPPTKRYQKKPWYYNWWMWWGR